MQSSQVRAWLANILICAWWVAEGEKKPSCLFLPPVAWGRKPVGAGGTRRKQSEHKVLNIHAWSMILGGLFLFGFPNSVLISLSAFNFLAFPLSLISFSPCIFKRISSSSVILGCAQLFLLFYLFWSPTALCCVKISNPLCRLADVPLGTQLKRPGSDSKQELEIAVKICSSLRGSVAVGNMQKEFPRGNLMNQQAQKADSHCMAKHVNLLVLSLGFVAVPSVVQ